MLPVDEPVEELVEPEQDRGDGEPDAQQRERLERGVVQPPRSGGDPAIGGRVGGGGHGDLLL